MVIRIHLPHYSKIGSSIINMEYLINSSKSFIDYGQYSDPQHTILEVG